MSCCVGDQRHTAQPRLFLGTAESGEVYEGLLRELRSSFSSVPSRISISSCLGAVQVLVGVSEVQRVGTTAVYSGPARKRIAHCGVGVAVTRAPSDLIRQLRSFNDSKDDSGHEPRLLENVRA